MKTKLAILTLGLLLPMLAFGQQPGQPGDTANTVQAVSTPDDLPACMVQLDSTLSNELWGQDPGIFSRSLGSLEPAFPFCRTRLPAIPCRLRKGT